LTTASQNQAGSSAARRRCLYRHRAADAGVQLKLKHQRATVDLYLAVHAHTDLRQTARSVQREVVRALQHLADIEVSAVNVHLVTVVFPPDDVTTG